MSVHGAVLSALEKRGNASWETMDRVMLATRERLGMEVEEPPTSSISSTPRGSSPGSGVTSRSRRGCCDGRRGSTHGCDR